jgi:pilus assembly protein TadC
MPARKRWRVAVAVALAVVMYGWGQSPLYWLLGLVAAAVVGIGLGRFEPTAVRRRRLETMYVLPQALDLLRLCLRAGQPLRTAVETVAHALGPPVADLFGAVTNAISVGMSDAQAWQVLKDDPMAGFLARDLARSTAWGTAITDVLAHHSADLRRQGSAQRLAAATAVGVKAVLPLGICYLPAFMLVGVVPVIAGGLTGLLG